MFEYVNVLTTTNEKGEILDNALQLCFTQKNGGYNSITELIDDFWDYNGFCPDNKAVLLGFASLQQLLKSKEMFEYVNVLTTTNEKGERMNAYVGRHRDDLNALTQARRLEFREKKIFIRKFFADKNLVRKNFLSAKILWTKNLVRK
uniref:DUF7515 domain-containing protein n=1 Tax=Meloidogyne enterolobii TaxID=390850 RepID=A0A6V7XR60_MELEN|nr:unnamed protein product [Meloidogyne enterolobii]